MGPAALLALYAATDFWRSVASQPYDTAIEQGTRLSRQAEQVCAACSEDAPRFPEMQALWRQAAAAFRRASALRPEDAEPAYFLGHALYEAHDFEAAISAFEEGRRRSPEGGRAGDIAFELGTAHSRLGRFQRALDEYNRALRLAHDPYERSVLLINAAESMMALGRLEEAIPLYRRGVELGQIALRSGAMSSGSQALHLLGLAVALDRDEQEEKALATTRRALELDPQISQLRDPHVFFVPEGDIAYYEALKDLAQGKRPEAARWFGSFLRVVPKSPFVARARAHLAALGGEPAAGRRPLPVALGRLVAGVVSVDGPLVAPEIMATLTSETHWAALTGCVGDMAGARVEFTVTAKGTVSRVALKPAAPQAERCLLAIVQGIRFRVPDHPRPTRFVLRLTRAP